ncbi:JAB domain-containing protein [Candidatus Neomarinimicrobiota bacterium]
MIKCSIGSRSKKLKDAIATIDVKVHDHLIIAGNNYYSFTDNNLI